MENQTRSFDLKTLARRLRKTPPAPDPRNASGADGRVFAADLDEYVFRRLFLPIAKTERVPLVGLDFGRISHEDIADLHEALCNCEVFELFGIGGAFCDMRPAVSAEKSFI
jgi:hypothetical protein